MNNIFDDMRSAVKDANRTLRAADNVAGGLANLLVGRLRRVKINTVFGDTVLCKLKKELRNWNMQTKKWKN